MRCSLVIGASRRTLEQMSASNSALGGKFWQDFLEKPASHGFGCFSLGLEPNQVREATHPEARASGHGAQAPIHASVVRHHLRGPCARIVQPLQVRRGSKRRDFSDLVQNEVSGLSAGCDPPTSAEKPGNGQSLGEVLMRMPVVMLRRCFGHDTSNDSSIAADPSRGLIQTRGLSLSA